MTISSTTLRNEYAGSGSTGPYPYTFPITAPNDLAVYKVSAIDVPTDLAYPSQYTVTGAGNANGGSITLTTALAIGERLSIVRATPATQPASLRTAGTFLPAVHEDALDRGAMTVQQVADTAASAIRLHPAFDPADYTLAVRPPLAGQFLKWSGTGVAWGQSDAQPDITIGGSLGLSNGVDDTVNLQTAIDSADNGIVYGVPGQTYFISNSLSLPSNVVLDLNGATLKPIGSFDLLTKSVPAVTATANITSGATQGSDVLTLNSVANFVAGQVVRISTNYAVTMPQSWSRIKSINSGAKQITLDSPLQFTYAGTTITLNQQPLYGTAIIENGVVDLSAMSGAPGAVVNLAGYERAIVRNMQFKGAGAIANNIVGCITLAFCRFAIVEDCTAIDVSLVASVVSIQICGVALTSRIVVDGDCFGTICVACDVDTQTDIRYRGRYKGTAPNLFSVRAVKSSSCRHSTYENIYATDCETILEVFNCARVNAKNINGANIGLRANVGQTAVNYAATLGDGYMQHALFDGINLDNCGGNGFQSSGDANGRLQVTNVTARNVVGTPILIQTNNTRVAGAVIENWNTGATAGAGAIVSTATSPTNAVQIEGVIAIHSDTAKPVLVLAAGPKLYSVRDVASPSGNPIYDTTNGINPGAQNIGVGSSASLSRGPSVAVLSQQGHLEAFTLPNNKTMTFTFEGFACEFIISANTGKAVKLFAEHSTAALAIVANPGSAYENSSTPTSGKIGVFKGVNARVISIKNNVGGDVDIAIHTTGGAITAITDPA